MRFKGTVREVVAIKNGNTRIILIPKWCVCVCVCVCKREMEGRRERGKEGGREREAVSIPLFTNGPPAFTAGEQQRESIRLALG